jgi:predicted nucleotidyltransferase
LCLKKKECGKIYVIRGVKIMEKNLNKNDIEKITKFLIKNINPYLIYLFGSSVSGIFREDSDIDIAFVSDKEITEYEVFMLAQELADMLKRDVDLINLKKASTVFKAQIIGKGKVIYCSDDKRRMYFEMYGLKDYALLNEEREIILNSIKQRGHIYE